MVTRRFFCEVLSSETRLELGANSCERSLSEALSTLSRLRLRLRYAALLFEGVEYASFEEDGLVWFDTSVCVEKAESLLCLFGGGGVMLKPAIIILLMN